MAGKESEVRSGLLEKYKNLNKITLSAGIGAAAAGILIGIPWLVTIGLGSAVLDAAQIVVIDKINKKKRNEQKVIYQANGA